MLPNFSANDASPHLQNISNGSSAAYILIITCSTGELLSQSATDQ
jgi:hypothetical protein